MDDFCIFTKNSEESKILFNKINIFVNSLGLALNNKSKYFHNKNGINFCGYIINYNKIKVRKRSIKKIKNKIKLFHKGYINEQEITSSIKSFYGYSKHANSYYLNEKIKGNI